MRNAKLCLGTSASFDLPYKEQLLLFKRTGFDGFFTEYEFADTDEMKKIAESEGLIYQSVHAPYTISADLWQKGEKASSAVDTLYECLEACAKNRVPIMVAHAFIGFDEHNPTPAGIENYGKVAERAKKLGIKFALENTEGEEYLAYLMDAFKGMEHVGFCFDTGHEMCYNRSKDMLSLYGDRLLCTHINDNLGILDYSGEKIFWTDDLHLLPFDGIADWQDIAKRIVKTGYMGELTFELTRNSKPNRHENDKYKKMTPEEYITEVFIRACKVASLIEREKNLKTNI